MLRDGMTDVCIYEVTQQTDNQDQNYGWVSRKAAREANLLGMLRGRWGNREYGASKLRYPHATEFLRKIMCNLGACPQKGLSPLPKAEKD